MDFSSLQTVDEVIKCSEIHFEFQTETRFASDLFDFQIIFPQFQAYLI